MTNLQTPFCVILTHRHGVSIGLFINSQNVCEQLLKSTPLLTAQHYCAIKKTQIQMFENFEYFENQDFILARAIGKTAENLLNLYQFVLTRFQHIHQAFDIKSAKIENYIVGTGPGSFTGLRLGAAFVNGLNLASDLQLFEVQTKLVSELYEAFKSDKEILEEFIKELGTAYHPEDHASGFVTFFDLLFVLHNISDKLYTSCHVIIPRYGREPSPALRLRKE